MLAALTLEGLSRAWAARRLVGLVWLIQAAVATVVAFPFWWALRDALGPLPEADILGAGLHFGVLADLAELRPGLLGSLALTLVAMTGVGFVLGAVIAGGVLEVLGGPDDRPLGHRFGRGAGRFFGRMLRAGLLVGVGAVIVGALAVLPFVHLMRQYFRSGWDTGLAGLMGGAAALTLVVVFALLILDATRIVLVRSDGRVLPSLVAGLRLVLGHPLVWCGVWLMNAALLAVAVALYLTFRRAVPIPEGMLLVVVVAAQQAFVVVRTALRIALFASENVLVERLGARAKVAPLSTQPASSSSSLPPA